MSCCQGESAAMCFGCPQVSWARFPFTWDSDGSDARTVYYAVGAVHDETAGTIAVPPGAGTDFYTYYSRFKPGEVPLIGEPNCCMRGDVIQWSDSPSGPWTHQAPAGVPYLPSSYRVESGVDVYDVDTRERAQQLEKAGICLGLAFGSPSVTFPAWHVHPWGYPEFWWIARSAFNCLGSNVFLKVNAGLDPTWPEDITISR